MLIIICDYEQFLKPLQSLSSMISKQSILSQHVDRLLSATPQCFIHVYFAIPSASNLTLTALACASNPSLSASSITVGPRSRSPSAVNSCDVICFWNERVLTPENCLAKPFVGSV
jgi:hypothetical protein